MLAVHQNSTFMAQSDVLKIILASIRDLASLRIIDFNIWPLALLLIDGS